MERFPYLKQRGLKGLDGVAVLWEAIRELTDALFTEYTISKRAIESSGGAWQQYRQQILEFLDLPLVADEEIVRQSDLKKWVGGYRIRNGKIRQRCEVGLENGELVINGPGAQSYRLIPIDTHSFYRGVSPIIVAFLENKSGIVREMRIDSTRLGGGKVSVWERDRSHAKSAGSQTQSYLISSTQ